jgi:hypothetical protein
VLSWRALTRSLVVGEHEAVLSLDLIRDDSGEPRFMLRWFRDGGPDVPTRLTGPQQTAIEAFRRRAILEMTEALKTEPPAPPRPYIDFRTAYQPPRLHSLRAST